MSDRGLAKMENTTISFILICKKNFFLLAGAGILALCCWSCGNNTDHFASPVKNRDTVYNDSIHRWAILSFEKLDSVNPVLQPGMRSFIDPILHRKIFWEEKNVFNPAVVVKDNKIFMLYRAQDKTGIPDGTSRIGLAESTDGIHFIRHEEPVLFPGNDEYKKYEWPGGCEDPRVVEDDGGVYYMTYTAFDGELPRLMLATSTDLVHWTKRGSVFANAYQGKYENLWSKSGSIVSTYKDGKIIATKINGKYWMYWGDQFIWIATSDDLVNWTPMMMEAGEKPRVPLKGQALNMPELKIVVPTRDKKFDSDLVESGPPAMITDQGILLLFNSRNLTAIGDSSLPDGTYAASQVLLDKKDPSKILQRLDKNFLRPDRPYELNGQVNRVCFLEGLARFKGKYFLYYGTADSKIAVAVAR